VVLLLSSNLRLTENLLIMWNDGVAQIPSNRQFLVIVSGFFGRPDGAGKLLPSLRSYKVQP